jgi:hypothetical protein
LAVDYWFRLVALQASESAANDRDMVMASTTIALGGHGVARAAEFELPS